MMLREHDVMTSRCASFRFDKFGTFHTCNEREET